jgi:OmpA-OmpF porin, OOP family
MRTRSTLIAILCVLSVLSSIGCATKKYVRNRISERVTPLENRTGELEETSRRNTQDISRLSADITDVRGRADRAQAQATAATTRAEDANNRAGAAEQSVADLRTNLDRYSVQNTATINFAFNSAELTGESRESLDRLASQIKDRNNFILEIEGFADSRGSDTYNYQLTQKRADAVRRYLADQHSVSLYRMHVLGMGALRAVADNQTPEGRAQNRRVEIRLLSRTISTATAGARQGASSSGRH